MNRHSTSQALILAVKPFGEQNRMVTILSQDSGIMNAILYGGPKSKLRSVVSPYHVGKMWLYTDEKKNSVKISDFDVFSFRPGIRENLFKSWAASLCSELLIKTHAGGQFFEKSFLLANAFLDGLDTYNEYEGKTGLLRFLWRYLIFLGQYADSFHCNSCNIALQIEQEEKQYAYTVLDTGFLCPNCFNAVRDNHFTGFILSGEALNYLQQIETESPKSVRTIKITESTLYELKKILFYSANTICGQNLRTLDLSLAAF